MKKPKRKFELIRREYWECLDAGHRHQTKDIAAKCIAKALRPKKQISHHWTPAERRDVVRRFKAGERKIDIGRRYGVSGNRIAQIIRQVEWNERWEQEKRQQAPLSERIAAIVQRVAETDEPLRKAPD